MSTARICSLCQLTRKPILTTRINEISTEFSGSLLTPRQAEVVRLLVNGLTSKQIARSLGISKRTVEDHVTDARERANVCTRAELIAWAVSVFPSSFESRDRRVGVI
jgi:DNA-binding CsgD family transcriptional regulator